MKLTQLPENFTTPNWTKFFTQLCKDKNLLDEDSLPSTMFITRAMERLDREYFDKYLIAGVLMSILDSDYCKSVGVSPRLLTPTVIDREVFNYPARYPWKYEFFAKCCSTREEWQYFRRWIAVYTDALHGAGTSPPMIGRKEYVSWSQVLENASFMLDKGVGSLVQRYLDAGYITFRGNL